MQVTELKIPGVLLVQPDVFGDERGFFCETYREPLWSEHGIPSTWAQDNHSRSSQGVLRGMHFAIGDGQAKLVRCARGRILDVVVDLREGSPTYGEHEAVFRIDTLELHEGRLPGRASGLVFEWAAAHRSELEANWFRAQQGVALQPIEPLQ